jgi:hypothetical protein
MNAGNLVVNSPNKINRLLLFYAGKRNETTDPCFGC